MRKLVLFAHMSLDGFAGDKEGGLGFLTYNEELQQFADELVKTVGAPVYGKNTYHLMAGYWPTVLNDPNANERALAHAKWVQEIPKIVFSTTLESADWNNTTLIRDNVEEEIAKLKQQPGKDLVIFGSPGLAKSLMNLGLIDEYQLTLHPIILGEGNSLFNGNTKLSNLKLQSSKTLGSGVITLHYTN
ncbi:dihydrofolate reductase family protein [Dyadobacter sp. CY343]|uniref:dihydrofolate reductase family protein n=1 Tax=Dyadobacter sp. CY343 TaxID=2907299 RepID=UPI001F448039|nr:dihydrofolate reductase family protein [Dyadobacter sp. CY343]MCE7062274.1 dihydrofolate reductase family protein [Dyadobacter sp. CY343]